MLSGSHLIFLPQHNYYVNSHFKLHRPKTIDHCFREEKKKQQQKQPMYSDYARLAFKRWHVCTLVLTGWILFVSWEDGERSIGVTFHKESKLGQSCYATQSIEKFQMLLELLQNSSRTFSNSAQFLICDSSFSSHLKEHCIRIHHSAAHLSDVQIERGRIHPLEVGDDLFTGGWKALWFTGLETKAVHDLLQVRHLRQQVQLMVLSTTT